MTMPTPWEWLTGLLDCAVDELDARADAEIKGAPPRQYMSTEGLPVFDDCCEEGGQVWTRILTAMPVNPLPIQSTAFHSCGQTMGVQIGVGIVRCGHTIIDIDTPPRASDLTDDSRQITEDMVTLARAILCCVDERRKVLGRWSPAPGGLNIGGGCVGGEWDVWVPASFQIEETSP